MLAKTFRPSSTPCLEHQQALLQQDHVRRFLGDIDGRVDADAHVGGSQGRRVVDAVAHEADGVPRACSAWMIRCLWAGETRANSVVSLGGLGQLSSVIASTCAAQQHVLGG